MKSADEKLVNLTCQEAGQLVTMKRFSLCLKKLVSSASRLILLSSKLNIAHQIRNCTVRHQQLPGVYFARRDMSFSPIDKVQLPPKPLPPSEEDCCDSGCSLCVKDIYQQELKIWEAECRRIQLNQAPKSELSPTSYVKCSLLNVQTITHNTNLYTFDSKGYVDVKPGQHMVLRETVNGSYLTRQYTPVTVPSPTQHTLQFMIKIYEDGPMSSVISNRWRPGIEVEWRGPLGLYVHQPDKYMKIVMLAAGTGLAPMLNIGESIVTDESDISNIKLLYACQTYEDVLLKQRIKKLGSYWNFTSKFMISRQTQEQVNSLKSYGENASAGKITEDVLREEITKPVSTRILVCGTRNFDSSMLEHLRLIGVPEGNIYKF